MFNVEISLEELKTILIALKDSKERLSKHSSKISCNFSDLSEDLKLFWRSKEEYIKYNDTAAEKCFREMERIEALEEKFKKYKKKEAEKWTS